MSLQIRRYLAEAIGTLVLVGFGTGSILAALATDTPLQAAVPLGFGLALLIGLYMVGEVSGGHFNPAVSLAAFLDRRIGLGDMIGYWIAQIVGGILGSAAVLLLVDGAAEQLGSSGRVLVAQTYLGPGPGVGDGVAFFGEVLFTAAFVMAILAVTRSLNLGRQSFMAISLSLSAVHFIGVPLTGASVNPARSLAPAVIGDFGGPLDNSSLWIYLLAPLVGAALGWVVYRFVVVGDTNLMAEDQPEAA